MALRCERQKCGFVGGHPIIGGHPGMYDSLRSGQARRNVRAGRGIAYAYRHQAIDLFGRGFRNVAFRDSARHCSK
jgi:hypothetical protein